MRQVFVSALVTVLFAGQASAIATYTYTGNNFTDIVDSDPPAGTYTTAMSVTGSFTVAAVLAPNLANQDITLSILSFSFSDGRQTFTDTTALPEKLFLVSTDAVGSITDWLIVLRTSTVFPFDEVTTHTVAVGVADTGFISVSIVLPGDSGGNSNDPGTWTLVPEPSTVLLLVSGLAALAVRRRRAL